MKSLLFSISKILVIAGALLGGTYIHQLNTEIRADLGDYYNGPIRLRCLRPGKTLTVNNGFSFTAVYNLPHRPSMED